MFTFFIHTKFLVRVSYGVAFAPLRLEVQYLAVVMNLAWLPRLRHDGCLNQLAATPC